MPLLISLQGKVNSINIAEAIGIQWQMVGIALLNDVDGTIVRSIDADYGSDVKSINLEILRRWICGRGIPDHTWQGLLGVLRVHCAALAESVEEALNIEEGKSCPC